LSARRRQPSVNKAASVLSKYLRRWPMPRMKSAIGALRNLIANTPASSVHRPAWTYKP